MENSIPLLLGLAALLVLSIILLLIWRVIRLRQGDRSRNMQYLNLTELRKQGLLSDVEMKQVSTALARQMERREQDEKRKHAARRASELELDPEVRRMEIQAEVARLARLQAAEKQPMARLDNSGAGESVAGNNGEIVDSEDDLWETLADDDAGTEETIEMPPDVVALYESGIITEEEFKQAEKKYREQARKN